MSELNDEKQREIIEMISQSHNNEEVNYLGSNRFVLRKPLMTEAISGEKVLIYQDILFDEGGNQIELSKQYNSIFTFRFGIAIVCLRKNFEIKNGYSSMERKYGVINTKGEEVIPCEYDAIKLSADGYIEFSKLGRRKWTYAKDIIDGSFDWESAIEV